MHLCVTIHAPCHVELRTRHAHYLEGLEADKHVMAWSLTQISRAGDCLAAPLPVCKSELNRLLT